MINVHTGNISLTVVNQSNPYKLSQTFTHTRLRTQVKKQEFLRDEYSHIQRCNKFRMNFFSKDAN